MSRSLLIKSIVTGTSAALLVACPAVDASAHGRPPAHPAHSHAGHKPHPGHKPSHPAHDRLAGPRKGAAHAITAQQKAMAALQERVATLQGPDAAALSTAVAGDATAVQDDLTAVASATSVRSLRTLLAHAVTTRQVARTQVLDVTAADAALAEAARLNATVTSLGSSLAALASGGTDTTAGQQTLTDATTQLTAVGTDAASVVQTILPVPPAGPLHQAAVTASGELTAIIGALAAASNDIATVQSSYGL